ncbi:hypothetical protein ASD45_19125 [Pseudolabrys sp. Root1462]|uniref:hypothetical protein n=1 Tax=Pseudolabrys sp. Root1462 TaxID=1736466 RepID=UPI000702D0B8|nr:hypothetical protein [Pseudolabrys sp. Root1462]KQY98093.1 hypothetical protein ASD45_19125 [Pseudolabrys sp. Root1462]
MTLNSRGRPSKGGPKPQINVKLNEAVFAKIKARADADFTSPSTLVAEVVEAAFSGRDTVAATGGEGGLGDTRAEAAKLDLEIKRTRFDQARGQLVRVENVLQFYHNRLLEIKSRGVAFVNEVARETGLNGRDLTGRYLSAMSGSDSVPEKEVRDEATAFAKAPPAV